MLPYLQPSRPKHPQDPRARRLGHPAGTGSGSRTAGNYQQTRTAGGISTAPLPYADQNTYNHSSLSASSPTPSQSSTSTPISATHQLEPVHPLFLNNGHLPPIIRHFAPHHPRNPHHHPPPFYLTPNPNHRHPTMPPPVPSALSSPSPPRPSPLRHSPNPFDPALRHPVFFTANLKKPPFPLPAAACRGWNPVASGYVFEEGKRRNGGAGSGSGDGGGGGGGERGKL